jgi:hypothetical protein
LVNVKFAGSSSALPRIHTYVYPSNNQLNTTRAIPNRGVSNFCIALAQTFNYRQTPGSEELVPGGPSRGYFRHVPRTLSYLPEKHFGYRRHFQGPILSGMWEAGMCMLCSLAPCLPRRVCATECQPQTRGGERQHARSEPQNIYICEKYQMLSYLDA